MAPEPSSTQGKSSDERAAKKALRKAKHLDVADLEKRVHLAELRAREAEAEIRYMEASAKRRSMKSEKKDQSKGDAPSAGNKKRAAGKE